MELYCCQTHVGQGLDEFVAKTESYPILTELSDSKKLSTKCNYCEERALYLVADKSNPTICRNACGYVHKLCGQLVCKFSVKGDKL